jgi:hypothetical protein
MTSVIQPPLATWVHRGFTHDLPGGRLCARLSATTPPLRSVDQHLSVSEARTFTGKSESTLKRMLREIVIQPNHPDRPFILPSPEEVERRKAENEPYAWKIDRALLLRRFPVENSAQQGSGGPPVTEVRNASPELMLQILREQLSSKDQQIRTLETQLDRKDEQIGSLNERMRESNVLMRELQQRLAIAPPKPPGEATVEAPPKAPDVKPAPPATAPKKPAQKSKPPPASAPSKPKASKNHRGLFVRWFGGGK